jgi:hypothetical protein
MLYNYKKKMSKAQAKAASTMQTNEMQAAGFCVNQPFTRTPSTSSLSTLTADNYFPPTVSQAMPKCNNMASIKKVATAAEISTSTTPPPPTKSPYGGRPRNVITKYGAQPKGATTKQTSANDVLAVAKAMQEATIAYYQVKEVAKFNHTKAPDGSLINIIKAALAKHNAAPDTCINMKTIITRVDAKNFKLILQRRRGG